MISRNRILVIVASLWSVHGCLLYSQTPVCGGTGSTSLILPSRPSVNGLIIYTAFPSGGFSGTENVPSFAVTIAQNLSDYYDEMSYNAHHLNVQVIQRPSPNQGKAFMANNSVSSYQSNLPALNTEILDKAWNENNNVFNGVDIVFMFYGGNPITFGTGWAALPHTSTHYLGCGAMLEWGGFGADEENIHLWNLSHEYGHMLSPDGTTGNRIYDQLTNVTGIYNIMYNNYQSGTQSMPAYLQIYLGWIQNSWIREIDPDIHGNQIGVIIKDTRILPASGFNAARIAFPGASSEHFIIENRQGTGSDDVLSGTGLIIWHMQNYSYNQTTGKDVEIAVPLGAHGQDWLDDGIQSGEKEGFAADFFNPTNKPQFTLWTNPNTETGYRYAFAHTRTNLAVTNIAYDTGTDMRFDLIANFSSGNITANSWWDANEVITGNVTVVPSVTLTISSGANVTLNPGVVVTVQGTLSIASNVTISGSGTIVTSGSGKIYVTSSADATAFNNSRKLVRDSAGNYHLVFESDGEICYEKWISSGTALSEFRRLSSGSGNNKFPSIAERSGKLYVVWQRYDGSSHDIFFSKSTNGGTTWSAPPTEIASNVGSSSPLPVIISSATDNLTVIYRTSTNLSSRISTNDGVNWSSGFVPSTNSSDNTPSLAMSTTYWGSNSRSCLAYARAPNTIYYTYYRNGTDSSGWGSTRNLSQIVPGTYTDHKNPSIAHSGTSGNKRLHVAWEARNTSSNYRVVIHRKATDWFTWPSVYSLTYYQEQQLPSITGLQNDSAELLFQMISQSSIYKIHYDGAYWGNPVYVAAGRNPSASIGNTQAKYVWSQGSTAPYEVKISAETLSKAAADSLQTTYHRSVAILDTAQAAWLEIRLDNMSIKTVKGEEWLIPFAQAREDSSALTVGNAFANLASELVNLPADAESLSVQYTVSGKGLSAIKNFSTDIDVALALIEQSGNTTTVPLFKITTENLQETKQIASVNVAGMSNKQSSLQMQISGVTNKSSLVASLGHVYEVSEKNLAKFLARAEVNASLVHFDLTVHPNPFNPSTQVRFYVPSEGMVTVRVYDVSGRMVKELSHGFRAAGEHGVVWDGRDHLGKTVASGTYFSEVRFGDERKVAKMMLVR